MFILTTILWFTNSSLSIATIRFGYIPNATIGFSLLKHNKNNDFNINFNLGNNFYLKLNDKMALFAGANIGISGLLNQNNRATLPQYTSINSITNQQSANTSNVDDNDGTAGTLTKNNTGNNEQIHNGLNYDIIINENQFQYIKNEYPNAETYANEIRSALINQANENIEANKLAIDNWMQEGSGDELFLDSSKPASSPLNINYETIKNAINNDKFFNNNIYLDKYTGDGYINWDEAIAIYHTVVGDGNNENAKIYAQLMTGLKNRPENFDNDPYNILLTDDGKQQLYATHDRMQIINDNNNITQSIINHVLQDKKDESNGINSIGDIVAYDKISIEEIKTIIQNTANYNKVIALQDDANDDYTSWNEAKNEYKQYLDAVNKQHSVGGITDSYSYQEQDAEKYAMIMTGLTEAPNNYDNDPYVILERERQELEKMQHSAQADDASSANSVEQTQIGQNNDNDQSTNDAKNTNVDDDILVNAEQANEKVVDQYSFRERFNFSVPIGVNVKINDKVSVEPYWLVGFNVAQANVIQNNNSTRLTKVGFTTGLGTRVLFCKELFFVGLEYRFAQNTFESTKIHSHNVNLSIGVRFNFTALTNLLK